MANLPNVAIEAASLLSRLRPHLQGHIEVPPDMAWYMSNHPMCAAGIPVADLGDPEPPIITEDIDCEIVDPKALPPSERD